MWHRGHVVPAGSGRERFVLALLLLNANRVTGTDQLIDGLWDDPPPTAKSQLYNMISNMRKRMGAAGSIVTRPRGYELRLGPHRLDVVEFRRLTELGRQAVADGDPARAVAPLTHAASLWRGPALADVADILAAGIRESLHEERLASVEVRLDAELALGRYDQVLRELRGLTREYPYRERLYERQLIALARGGRRVDALRAYQQIYRRFVHELGIEPDRSLRDLHQWILRGDPPPLPTRLLVG
jgi:DNA-binding SARP family transcriptional activator